MGLRQDPAGLMAPPFDGALFRAVKSAGVSVLVLHGADGQRRDAWAQRFADEGFDALAIRWFGEEGIVKMPRETVSSAATWLQREIGLPVAVAGHSKGAELALAAAAYDPGPLQSVLAWSPSAVTDGKAIPLERFPGRVLLVSGTDDKFWPAEEMARIIVRRMLEHGRADDVVHVSGAGAGHLITPDTVGLEFPGIDMGGQPDADRELSARAWQQAVEFLGDCGRLGSRFIT